MLWYLFQFSPDYVQGEYATFFDDPTDTAPRADHTGLMGLFTQGRDYTPADLAYVIDQQHAHGERVAHVQPAGGGGPSRVDHDAYYHPIMPLLMMPGWTFEDGIHVNKDAWPVDRWPPEHRHGPVRSGTWLPAHGMWPPNKRSPPWCSPWPDVGVEWMVSDEGGQVDHAGRWGIDVEDAALLATPWVVSGDQGGDVAVIFRDRVISDRVAFQYGSMTPEAAVSDFLSYLDGIRAELLEAGEDPSEHLLTVAMDGENWMFMSEFSTTTTPAPSFTSGTRGSSHPPWSRPRGEFLADDPDLPRIETVGTGSWIDGTLSTWAGEADESLAWQRLVEARRALVAFEADNPDDPGLDLAWESLYIAEAATGTGGTASTRTAATTKCGTCCSRSTCPTSTAPSTSICRPICRTSGPTLRSRRGGQCGHRTDDRRHRAAR